MSHQAVTWAYDQDITPSGAKFVLVTLANYANGEGYCYPGQDKLARDTGMTARAVRKHLNDLEAAGLIARERRTDKAGRRKSDGYWLAGMGHLPEELSGNQPEEYSGSQAEKDSGSQPENISEPTGKKRHHYRKNLPVHIRNINRQSEPSEEPSEQAAETPPNAPYRLYEICCDLNGGSASGNPTPSKQLAVFSRLLSRYSFSDIEGCMCWLATDDFWQRKGFDAFNVETQIDKYLMLGRPTEARAIPPRNGRAREPDYSGIEEFSRRMDELEQRR